jgi:hypothetical protein
MIDRPRDLPTSPEDAAAAERMRRDKGKGPKHVLETWLPPGVSIDEAEDPGANSATPATPAKPESSRDDK